MMTEPDDDPKLREVKAILHRLQRVSSQAEPAPARPAKEDEEVLARLKPVAPVVPLPAKNVEEARAARRELVIAVSDKDAKKGGPRIVSGPQRAAFEVGRGAVESGQRPHADEVPAAVRRNGQGPEVPGPARVASGGRRGKRMALVLTVGVIAVVTAITTMSVNYGAIDRWLGTPAENLAVGQPEPAVSRPEPALSKPEPALSKPEPALAKPEPALAKPNPAVSKPADRPRRMAALPDATMPPAGKIDPLAETGRPKIPLTSDSGNTLKPLTLDELLREAQRLMTAGEIVSARVTLEKAAGGESAEVAFALARSYDPNFLKSLPSADADPDVAEAERWYRRWHEIAVRDGLVTDVKLERLIGSMR